MVSGTLTLRHLTFGTNGMPVPACPIVAFKTMAMKRLVISNVGGCSCGAVRYEITAEPIRGFQCQCRDCQRDSGSGHTSVWVFPRTAFKATGPLKDSVRVADSGDAKVKCFCEVCGSPISARSEARHAWPLCRKPGRSERLSTSCRHVRLTRQSLGFSRSGGAKDCRDEKLIRSPTGAAIDYAKRIERMWA